MKEKQAPIIPLPICSIGDCGRVATRRLFSLEVDGEFQGAIRLCWEHIEIYQLDKNDRYESEGDA